MSSCRAARRGPSRPSLQRATAPRRQFGNSVAVSGSTAVVGATYHTVGSNAEQGAAYVFVQSGTTWTQQAELTVVRRRRERLLRHLGGGERQHGRGRSRPTTRSGPTLNKVPRTRMSCPALRARRAPTARARIASTATAATRRAEEGPVAVACAAPRSAPPPTGRAPSLQPAPRAERARSATAPATA